MSRQRQLQRLPEWTTRAPARRLLMAAATIHLGLSLLLNLVGRFKLLPHLLDPEGISGALGFDSFYYRRKVIELVATLARGDIADWFYAPYPFHTKLYSLSFAVLGPLTGFTMLGAEPLNLLYYLLILTLVFKLGEEVYDRRVALIAAGIVALWPSFLLHTTQLLRDPLLILSFLTLVFITTRWITRAHTLRRGLAEALPAGAASAVIWLTRYNMWTIVMGVVLVCAVSLVIRVLRARRWLWGNLAGALLLLVVIGSVPGLVGRILTPDSILVDPTVEETPLPPSPCPDDWVSSDAPPAGQSDILSRMVAKADEEVARIGKLRRGFDRLYADAGSNIDTCVRLNGVGDLLRYLPRAIANGFFTPYPWMWFKAGSAVGIYGRVLSGIEMLAMYVVELFAIAGLWAGQRRKRPAWLLALVATAGILSLGLVVANIGVLFRLRYVFSMLLIILGAAGVRHMLELHNLKKSDPEKSGP